MDPLIRLQALDENSSREVSALLSYFRRLQREHHLALLLVHHMRKNGSGMAGDSLRGSSDLHAWGDVNLYLRRTAEGVLLTAEHRAHASPDPLLLRLEPDPQPHLVAANATSGVFSPDDHILDALQRAGAPLTTRQLCAGVRGRTQVILDRLHDLAARGVVRRDALGWVPAQLDLLPQPPANAFPVSRAYGATQTIGVPYRNLCRYRCRRRGSAHHTGRARPARSHQRLSSRAGTKPRGRWRQPRDRT